MAAGTQRGGISGARRTDSVLDTLAGLCYPIYTRLFDEDDDLVKRIDRKLDEALRDTTVEMYLSRAVVTGIIAAVGLAVVGWLSAWAVAGFVLTETPVLFGLSLSEPWLTVINTLKTPLLVIVSGLVLGGVGFVVGFWTPITKRSGVRSGRSRIKPASTHSR